MSSSSAARVTARPAARPGGRTTPLPPRLRVVSAPAHARSRAGLVVLCVVMLLGGLVALLMLNISLSHGSYELYQLQAEGDKLAEQQQTLSQQLAAQAAPQELARSARRLGMVPVPGVAFLQLDDGRVVGAPKQAKEPPAPKILNQP